jgi:hypothetical protein
LAEIKLESGEVVEIPRDELRAYYDGQISFSELAERVARGHKKRGPDWFRKLKDGILIGAP